MALDLAAMAFYPVRVVRAVSVTPHLRRVSVAGEQLARFPFAGPDQRVKLLLPQAGQDEPQLDGVSTIPEILALPDAVRPIMRTYTVRRHRPDACEIDIDFALHAEHPEQMGPASAWAAVARPGDRVALYGPAASYDPPADTAWQLVAGDESALPAITAILEHLPADSRGHVLIEIPDDADRQPLDLPSGVEVRWLSRAGRPAAHSTLLADAVRDLPLPDEPGYVWLAGESGVVTGLRRHLVADRGLPRERITFTGYWRHGRAEGDA